MPMPFQCIYCAKPVPQVMNGVCADCEKKK